MRSEPHDGETLRWTKRGRKGRGDLYAQTGRRRLKWLLGLPAVCAAALMPVPAAGAAPVSPRGDVLSAHARSSHLWWTPYVIGHETVGGQSYIMIRPPGGLVGFVLRPHQRPPELSAAERRNVVRHRHAVARVSQFFPGCILYNELASEYYVPYKNGAVLDADPNTFGPPGSPNEGDGARVWLWTPNGGSNQSWQFMQVPWEPPGAFFIVNDSATWNSPVVNGNHKWVVLDADSNTENQWPGRVQLWQITNGANQIWSVDYRWSSTAYALHNWGTVPLDILNADTNSMSHLGTRVQIWHQLNANMTEEFWWNFNTSGCPYS